MTLTRIGTDRYSPLWGYFGGSGGCGIVDFSPIGLPVLVTRMSVPAGIFRTIGDDRYDYCFAAGTLVLMADGSRKPIETIAAREGRTSSPPDYDPEGPAKNCRVLQVYRNAPARILHVRVGGEVIRATFNHPFYVRGKGWTAAEKLQAGDRLRTHEGNWVLVEGTEDSGQVEPVFNLHVEASQTYFVAASERAPGVLVHNDSVALGAGPGLEVGEAGTAVGAAPETAGASMVLYACLKASEAIYEKANSDLAEKFAHRSATNAEMDAAEADRMSQLKGDDSNAAPTGSIDVGGTAEINRMAVPSGPNDLQKAATRHQQWQADNAAYFASEKAAAAAEKAGAAPQPAGTGNGAAPPPTQTVAGSPAAPDPYERPSGFRQGVREEAWNAAKGPDGLVRDPQTGKVMDPNQPWDMGHKPGYEFRKHQASARERGISRDQFLDEYNKSDHYRPELPSSNRNHKGEDMSDEYLGD